MRNTWRLLRRALVRLFEVILSVSAPLLSALAGTGRNFSGKPPSSWRSTTFHGASSRSRVGHSRAGDGYFHWYAVVFVILLVFGASVIIQLELSLFKLVDHRICVNLLGPEVYITTPTLKLASAKVEFLTSSRLIVRAVYLDPRPRNGFINTSVFLVEVHKGLVASEAILACGTSSGITFDLTVRVVMNSQWVHTYEPDLTHDVAMVDCFGLPKTQPGSRAFLWYRHSASENGEAQLYRVESEQPYFVPPPKQTLNEDDLKIVVCMGIVRDYPPYMKEFLRYYKHLGVDHIYMIGEDSFLRNGGLQSDEFVLDALGEDFISFNFWHQWLSTKQVFYHSQMLAHEDCIYRFQGTYDYAFLVDSDDHFIPRVPHRTTLDFYIEKYCRFGSCIFPWLEYFPDCGQRWDRLGSHGNITNTLVSQTHHRRLKTGKSIHRLTAILDAGTHRPQLLLKGYRKVYVPPNVAYVAHVRKNKEPPNGLQSC